MKKLLFIPLLVIAFSCSTQYSTSTPDMAYVKGGRSNATMYEIDGVAVRSVNTINTVGGHNIEPENIHRMVLYSASLTLVVREPDSTAKQIAPLAEKYGGYIVSQNPRMVRLRVNAEQLQSVVNEISSMGRVNHSSVSGNDVTDKFTDLQIRLDNAHKARNRYLELLEKAENVEAALKVEKELERLNTQIDSLEGQIRNIRHQAELSLVTVHLQERTRLGPLGYLTVGTFKAVKWLFVRN